MGTARQASSLGLPCSLSSFLWNSVCGMRSSLWPFRLHGEVVTVVWVEAEAPFELEALIRSFVA